MGWIPSKVILSTYVNWCPSCTTAISDDEAEYQRRAGATSGSCATRWRSRSNGQSSTSPSATARPETMLGDTGVAVSPSDGPGEGRARGQDQGDAAHRRPRDPRPSSTDWHVDAGFGTGFVKVTPAHDPNDYAMGARPDTASRRSTSSTSTPSWWRATARSPA